MKNGFRNIHVGTSWNDFFGNKNYEKLYRKNGVETFFNGAATSFFISRCIYINLHPKGAIIFLNTIDNMDIFINDSTFRSCYTDYQDLPGGSFYWRSSGSCIQSRNCYYQSWCSKSGQAYGVSVSSNGINHCNFTTLFKIGVDPNKYMFTIGQSYGNVIINNNNQTECKCSLVAGFGTT